MQLKSGFNLMFIFVHKSNNSIFFQNLIFGLVWVFMLLFIIWQLCDISFDSDHSEMHVYHCAFTYPLSDNSYSKLKNHRRNGIRSGTSCTSIHGLCLSVCVEFPNRLSNSVNPCRHELSSVFEDFDSVNLTARELFGTNVDNYSIGPIERTKIIPNWSIKSNTSSLFFPSRLPASEDDESRIRIQPIRMTLFCSSLNPRAFYSFDTYQ